MNRSRMLSGIALAGASLFITSAQGATVTYEFDRLLSGDSSLAGTDFATLTVESGDGLSEPWSFRLSAYNLAAFGPGSFFGALAVDGSVGTVAITGTSAGSGISNVKYSRGGGPGGAFDFRFDLTGPKRDRQTQGEWVEWTATGISGISAFGAHIQGIGPKGSSAWFGTSPLPAPVPLPATFWLLATAFLGFAGIKRWFKKQTGDIGLVTTRYS